jgi:hypothetical protein
VKGAKRCHARTGYQQCGKGVRNRHIGKRLTG